MSETTAHDPKAPRERTVSRMRYVAPPGMSVGPSEERKTIGRYEILETIGKGAMGVVYKARDPLLDRVVAVKTIGSPRGVARRVKNAYLERFEREAKAAAKMQHPAIVTIFDVGLEDGAPYMVLEYLPGETLADHLDRVRMPLGKGVQIALDLGSAIGFAHRERIVHRDLKPANVLHTGENRWKLADFGIARMPDSDLTQVGIFMGTPGYSPPEAIREGRYTPQADVFAWGAVLYELLSGSIPYEGPDTQTTNGYVLQATAPSPRHYDPSIPEPLAEVAMHALAPNPNMRYRDGSEAEEALRVAWEHCLTTGLVAPSALAGVEIEHEKLTGPMHGKASAPPPPSRAPRPRGGAAQLVMEALGKGDSIPDEAPTRVMARDQRRHPPGASGYDFDAPTRLDGPTLPEGLADEHRRTAPWPTVPDPAAPRRVGRPEDSSREQTARAHGGETLRYIFLLVILAVGAIASYYHYAGQ